MFKTSVFASTERAKQVRQNNDIKSAVSVGLLGEKKLTAGILIGR